MKDHSHLVRQETAPPGGYPKSNFTPSYKLRKGFSYPTIFIMYCGMFKTPISFSPPLTLEL